MLEGFKDRADGMPYALYILQTPSPRHTDQVKVRACRLLPALLRCCTKMHPRARAPPTATSVSCLILTC